MKKYISVNLRTDPKKNRLVVNRGFAYKEVFIPQGYTSDGLTKLINKYQPNCLRAAIVHDYVCDTHCIPRKKGDEYFREILKLDGVGRFQRNRYYWAVCTYRILTFKK